MPNRALQAKTIKLQKQNAARPYIIDARSIVLADGEKFRPMLDPSKRKTKPAPKREKYVTPLFQITNWTPETRLIKAN